MTRPWPLGILLGLLAFPAMPGGAAPTDAPPPPSPRSAEPSVPVIAPEQLPDLARKTRQSGTVVIEALVDEQGAVRRTNVVRSLPALDDLAAARVAALSFPPLLVDGKAVAATHLVPVTVAPPGADPLADAFTDRHCGEAEFHLDVDVRPDSSGVYGVRWTARGLKSQELFVIAMFPDGVVVDTTGSYYPQRFLDQKDAAGWPAWHRDGRTVRKGTSGAFTFTKPADVWWRTGRVAIVALFRDVFDGTTVYRPHVFRLDEDAEGPLLLTDPAAGNCAAGPYLTGR